MKHFFLLGIIGVFLFSCGEKDDIDNVNDGISLDSLVTISSNLPFARYIDLMFIDENIGYVLSDNFIAKTTDGGYSWASYELPIVNVYFPRKMQFIDNQIGYIIAGNNNTGVLLKTTDGGQNWNTIDLNTYEYPSGMFFLNRDTGFIVGKGLFVKTLDGGESWINLKKETTFLYFGINFKNDKEGIVTSSNGCFHTTDGGATWNNYNTTDYLSGNIYFVENKILVSRNGDPCLFDLTNNEGINLSPCFSMFVFFNSEQSIATGIHYEELGYFPYNDIYVTNNGWRKSSQKILSSTTRTSTPCIAKMSDNKVMIIYTSLSHTYIAILKK